MTNGRLNGPALEFIEIFREIVLTVSGIINSFAHESRIELK